jgi:hypothetical protein
MTEPYPGVRELARRLLDSAGAGSGADRDTAAAASIVAALRGRLVLLVGSTGFGLLLGRALQRAQRDHPLLVEVRLGEGRDGALSGLEEAAGRASPGEAGAAMEALVAELVALMARFLGADMVARLVRQALPDAPLMSIESGSEEESDE